MQIASLDELLDEPYLTTAKKLISVEEIPKWGELTELFGYFKGNPGIYWEKFCADFYIFQVFCYEFVENLAEEIKKRNVEGDIVEVAAGNGKLSYWLKQFGLKVTATDAYVRQYVGRQQKYVEQLSHKEALEKYEPELVIGCWLPYESKIDMDVLDWRSVGYYLNIGEGRGGCTGSRELWDRKDADITYLESTDPFCLSGSNYAIRQEVNRSFAALFRKK